MPKLRPRTPTDDAATLADNARAVREAQRMLDHFSKYAPHLATRPRCGCRHHLCGACDMEGRYDSALRTVELGRRLTRTEDPIA